MGDEALEGDLESIQEGNSHHLGMRALLYILMVELKKVEPCLYLHKIKQV